MSRADYLAIERNGIIRHEWVGGQIYAMTGGTRLHHQISFRLARSLADAADADGCQTFVADMKVLTEFAGTTPGNGRLRGQQRRRLLRRTSMLHCPGGIQDHARS
jgi:Uma2 family endonuclease